MMSRAALTGSERLAKRDRRAEGIGMHDNTTVATFIRGATELLTAVSNEPSPWARLAARVRARTAEGDPSE